MPRTNIHVKTVKSPRKLSVLSPATPVVHVETFLSTPAFIAAWWALLLLHLTNFLICAVLGLGYFLVSRPTWYESLVRLQIPIPVLRASGVAFSIVAILHAQSMLAMCWRSFRVGRLSFHGPKPRVFPSLRLQAGPSDSIDSSMKGAWVGKAQTTVRRMTIALDRVAGNDGYVGVNGQFFYLYFNTAKVLEILTSTYQAYQISRSVQRPWINNLAVAVVFGSAASSIMLYATLHKNERKLRLVHVIVDSLVDFGSGILLPVCVIYPYARLLFAGDGKFTPELAHNDIWYSNAIAEARQILVTSPLDLVATIFPHFSFYLGLLVMKTLLLRRRPRLPHGLIPSQPSNQSRTSSRTNSHGSGNQADPGTVRPGVNVLEWLFNGGILAWAIAVLVIHIRANRTSQIAVTGCLLPLQSWFATNASCAFIQINCYHEGIVGTPDDLTGILGRLERDVVAKIVFAHCPQLEIPEVTGGFHNLLSVDTYNCTLVDWSMRIAPTSTRFPSLNHVNFLTTNMSMIPMALRHDDLPTSLVYFTLHECNLTSLPHSLMDEWKTHTWNTFALDHLQLASLPSWIGDLRVKRISAVGNGIDDIPQSVFASKTVKTLWLSSNPLQKFAIIDAHAEGDVGSRSLQTLVLEHIQVAKVPQWLLEWREARLRAGLSAVVSLYGTPYCETDRSSTTDGSQTYCGRNYNSTGGVYPYWYMAQQRPLTWPSQDVTVAPT